MIGAVSKVMENILIYLISDNFVCKSAPAQQSTRFVTNFSTTKEATQIKQNLVGFVVFVVVILLVFVFTVTTVCFFLVFGVSVVLVFRITILILMSGDFMQS